MGQGFAGPQEIGMGQENFSYHIGRGWDKTKSCGTGAKISSFGPAPPYCHPKWVLVTNFTILNLQIIKRQFKYSFVNWLKSIITFIVTSIYLFDVVQLVITLTFFPKTLLKIFFGWQSRSWPSAIKVISILTSF